MDMKFLKSRIIGWLSERGLRQAQAERDYSVTNFERLRQAQAEWGKGGFWTMSCCFRLSRNR